MFGAGQLHRRCTSSPSRRLTAYVVVIQEKVHDPEQIAAYSEKAGASLEGRPVTPLALYGKLDVLEGPAPQGAVLLQFPDMASARAWYDSADYQAARDHRLQGDIYRFFIIEGLA